MRVIMKHPFGMFILELYDGFVTIASFEHLSKIDNKTESAQSRMSEFVRNTSSLPLKPQGTPFQLRVRAPISKMVFREVSTHQYFAHSLGVPDAVSTVFQPYLKTP